MKGKRILSFLLVVILIVSFATGCKGPEKDPEPPVSNGEEEKPDDKGQELVAEEVLLKVSEGIMKSLPDDNYIIGADVSLEQFEENPGAIFWIDMRSKDDYDKGHFDGAINIPYADLGKNLDRIPTNKQVILQCYSGQTSAQAVAVFRMAGFNAMSYRGGMNFGWAPLELGEDTLVTTPVDLPDAKSPELDEEGQIIWDAAVKYFPADTNYIISPKDLHDLVEENPDAIMVLDIRSEEDFDKGHIEGAVHIPFKKVGENYDKLPDNKPIYVICYTGQTAGITTAMLRVAGFNAISLSRGMTGWDGEELPKVTK